MITGNRIPVMNSVSAAEKALNKFAADQSAMSATMASVASASALERKLKEFAANQSAMSATMASVASAAALERKLKEFAANQSAMSATIAAIGNTSALEDKLKSFASNHSAMSATLASVANTTSLKNAMNSLISHKEVMEESIVNFDFNNIIPVVEDPNLDEKFDDLSKKLSEAKDSQTFEKILKNSPSLFQMVLFFIFIDIFLAQVNNISANLLTPVIKSYLSGSESTSREKIKDIKRLPLRVDVLTNDLRFITGDNVRLRKESSTKSDILDELVLGQVVTVLSKNKNWIEIMYEYKDGEIMRGWVFTRYTTNFQN